MRPAAKIVNIFAASFSNFAIRMIFDIPFNDLVMHLRHWILPRLSKVDEERISLLVGYPGQFHC
jgi:hypothetical protein